MRSSTMNRNRDMATANRVSRNLVLRMPKVKRSQQSPGEVEKMTATLRNSQKKNYMKQIGVDHSQHTINSMLSPKLPKKRHSRMIQQQQTSEGHHTSTFSPPQHHTGHH